LLVQIKKIKSLGVFHDYSAAADLRAFGRYNIVYGENGSGKTTLSRLLACLEAGEHPDHPSLEYTVESQSGNFKQGTKYTRRVRVFNSDYVEANIGRFDGPISHILIVGEENKALAAELGSEIVTFNGRNSRIQTLTTEIAKCEGEKGKVFSQVAKTIGAATSGTTQRNYRRPNAEAAYAKLNSAKALSGEELEIHRATVRQEQLPIIELVACADISNKGNELTALDYVRAASSRCTALTQRSAQAAVIDRLAANPKIAAWVEEGVHIHRSGQHEKCEFCDQQLPALRLKALSEHFSAEDQQLKEELDLERDLIGQTTKALNFLSLPDGHALYSELRPEFEATKSSISVEVTKLLAQLSALDHGLAKKLTLRTTSYADEFFVDAAPLGAAIDACNAVLKRHNEKTSVFDAARTQAADALEAHYLLEVQAQVEAFVTDAAKLQAEIDLLRSGGEALPDKRSLEELFQSIATKRAKVASAHEGGEGLTNHLKQFLGRTELKFEAGEDGYRVLRRGKPAKRLSEGEKTAIAFLHFLMGLKDQDFILAEGVVVIDDPISSLDASAIYQAFSFLKNETQTAKQLFILTHNFEFLRLLINWFENMHGVPKADRTYSMVLCSETEKGRSARLTALDKLLIEHATEYHYLFKVLYSFKSDGTILGCYHVPNVARKVLETFLDFHVPSKKNLYQKLDAVDFDPHKKTAILKFANDLSHFTGKGFDPALVAEAQKNVMYLLEMIEAVAPLHYKGLKVLSE